MSQPTFKPFHRAWIEVTSSSSLVFWGPSLWKPSNTKSIIVEPICSSRSLYLMNDAQWTKTGKIVWLMFFKTIYVVIQTSEGIKYSNQEYTRVGYPILGYFRVQVPENLCQTSLSSFKLARKFSSKLGT